MINENLNPSEKELFKESLMKMDDALALVLDNESPEGKMLAEILHALISYLEVKV